jgi:hypothetical protein
VNNADDSPPELYRLRESTDPEIDTDALAAAAFVG